MKSISTEVQQLSRYYLDEVSRFLETLNHNCTCQDLQGLMPQLQSLSKCNGCARQLFNEICFAGICPQYDFYLEQGVLKM